MTGPTLEKRDADLCRAFISIVKKGKFEIQGEALQQVGSLMSWFSTLDKKIEETLNKQSSQVIRKDLKGKK